MSQQNFPPPVYGIPVEQAQQVNGVEWVQPIANVALAQPQYALCSPTHYAAAYQPALLDVAGAGSVAPAAAAVSYVPVNYGPAPGQLFQTLGTPLLVSAAPGGPAAPAPLAQQQPVQAQQQQQQPFAQLVPALPAGAYQYYAPAGGLYTAATDLIHLHRAAVPIDPRRQFYGPSAQMNAPLPMRNGDNRRFLHARGMWNRARGGGRVWVAAAGGNSTSRGGRRRRTLSRSEGPNECICKGHRQAEAGEAADLSNSSCLQNGSHEQPSVDDDDDVKKETAQMDQVTNGSDQSICKTDEEEPKTDDVMTDMKNGELTTSVCLDKVAAAADEQILRQSSSTADECENEQTCDLPMDKLSLEDKEEAPPKTMKCLSFSAAVFKEGGASISRRTLVSEEAQSESCDGGNQEWPLLSATVKGRVKSSGVAQTADSRYGSAKSGGSGGSGGGPPRGRPSKKVDLQKTVEAPLKVAGAKGATPGAQRPSTNGGGGGGGGGGKYGLLIAKPSSEREGKASNGVGSEQPRLPKTFSSGDAILVRRLGEQIKEAKDGDVKIRLPIGFINAGNMCYVNAVMQALLACPQFFHMMTRLAGHCVPKSANLPWLRACVKMMDSMVGFSRSSGDAAGSVTGSNGPQCISLAELHRVARSMHPSSDGTNCQEDAQEFLLNFLNGLHEEMILCIAEYRKQPIVKTFECVMNAPSNAKKELEKDQQQQQEQDDGEEDGDWQVVCGRKKVPTVRRNEHSNSPMVDIFCGTFRASVLQPGCRESVNVESFFTVPLELQSANVTDLVSALEMLFSKETICKSVKDGKTISCGRTVTFDTLPNVLIFHLKYFSFNGNEATKLFKPFSYHVDLNIKQDYLAKHIRGKKKDGCRSYKLFAVVFHHGLKADRGHYSSMVCHGGKWLLIDDAKITPIDFDKQMCHQRPSQVPYLLFYRLLTTGQAAQ